ncbi:hypothetical protein [Mesorhizobium neociceri]|uniref:Uncharacterized protein n=1 Tax=Mesorhizobium neociceri TaxID=1307853 RepID=A0A838B6H1_9HYPH|nr:hypothetical protein [Mesorhizobium neociceri]MBA1141743.1 hypothetical protein [Mesorhizobium neociceri]
MTKVHQRPNMATPSEASSFVDEFDRLEQGREERLRVLDAEFKAKKRAIQKDVDDDQKTILEDAKNQGVNKGVTRMLPPRRSPPAASRLNWTLGMRTGKASSRPSFPRPQTASGLSSPLIQPRISK